MAIAGRIRKLDYRVYVICGDGELGEGLIWEGAMCAGHHRASNLTLFIDNNNYQSGGTVEEISGVYPIEEKSGPSAGTSSLSTVTTSDRSWNRSRLQKESRTGRRAIVAKTVKGKGVSFMVGDNTWHKRVYTDEEFGVAMRELGGRA